MVCSGSHHKNRSIAMSDSRRVYRAIKQALTQAYPDRPQGNRARHLETLVGMVSGIVLGKSCQLPKIASKVPGGVPPLVLIRDGRAGARGCVTLMVSLLYAPRALPIAWLVVKGAKGHFPA